MLARAVLYFVLLGTLAMNHGFAEQSLKFGTVSGFSPYVIEDTDGLKGIDIDMVKAVCKRLKQKCEFKQMAWNEVQAKLRSGKLDMGFSGFQNEERKSYAYFLEEYLHKSTFQVFVKPGGEFPFAELKDLVGMKFASGKGQKIGPRFDSMLASGQIKMLRFKKIEDMFQALDTGKVDGVIGNSQQYRYYLKQQYKLNAYRVLPGELTSSKPSYLMISKKAPSMEAEKIKEQWNKAFNELVAEGYREKLLRKYIGEEEKKRPVFQ